MNADTVFVQSCLELVQDFNSTIRSRSMFGGHGLFCEGVMFALVFDAQLYFKADKQCDDEFAKLKLPKFVYTRGKQPAEMSYRLAPESAFNNSTAMRPWFDLAFQAAICTDQAKSPSKRKWTGGGFTKKDSPS